MTEYLNSKNLTEAVSGVREMKAPKHFLPEMLNKIIVCSLDRPDEDKEHASTLIHTLRTEGLITGENFMQVRRSRGFLHVCSFSFNSSSTQVDPHSGPVSTVCREGNVFIQTLLVTVMTWEKSLFIIIHAPARPPAPAGFPQCPGPVS